MAAYFSHPSPGGGSDDVDAAAVEAIISQAADLCALEQIAKLNTLHLSDSSLPTELESRFRKLKSFPEATAPNPATPLVRRFSTHQEEGNKYSTHISSHDAEPHLSVASDDQKNKQKLQNIIPISSPDEKNDPSMVPEEQKRFTRSGPSSSPLILHGSSRNSPSPPRRQVCCFGFIPGKGRTRRKVQNDGVVGSELDADDWGIRGGDILAELKDQERKLKKVLKEQEKVNEGAMKVVELARRASARLNVAAVDDDDELLSDGDEGFK